MVNDTIDYFYITDEEGTKYRVLPDLSMTVVKRAKRRPNPDKVGVSLKL